MDGETKYAACPICLVFSKKEKEEEAKKTINKHNNSRHDGEDVAMVLDETIESFSEFVERCEEKGNDSQYKQLKRKMETGELPIFISAAEYQDIMDNIE
jgi:hypothetical protein